MHNIKKYIAELIGTCVLVLFGCGSAVFPTLIYGSALDVLGVSFAFGLCIVAMAYSIGTISGCHVNPAVSLAMFINKRLSAADFICYVVSQCIGAIIGGGIIKLIKSFLTDITDSGAMGTTGFGHIGMAGAFIAEVVLTFVFVLVIVAVTGKKGNGKLAGLVIGLTLVLIHLLGIPLTGTSVNPARSLGPALFANAQALEELWVFIAAPFIGAAIAAVVGKFVLDTEKE